MCLAIFKPAKSNITEDILSQGWLGNSDGAGFAYVHKGKVVISKGYMKLQEFLEAYRTASKLHAKSPFIIHFRIKSMGAKNEDNTHPFPIEGGALIHNGTLTGTKAEWDKGPSDTALFAQRYFSHLSYAEVHANKEEFEEAVVYNKIAMLYNSGQYIILNEKNGVWHNDVWYSNHSFKAWNSRSARTITADEASGMLGGETMEAEAAWRAEYRRNGYE